MSDRSEERTSKPLVLITGCSGLIGSRLMAALAARHRIVGLDVKEPRELPEGVSFVPCDLTSQTAVAEALERVREAHGDRVASVVHLAAYYDFSGEPSELYETLTVGGTRRLLSALQSFQVDQFIFSSTILVMQSSPDGSPIREDSPTETTWAYPDSKLETERLIEREHGDIPAVILRIAGVYDELGRSPAITEHIKRIHDKELTSFFFPGNAERGQAFVHIDDLVAAVELTISRRRQLEDLEVFLIAEPEVVPYEQLQHIIGEEIHDREWPTVRIPKPIAKAGAWVQEKVSPGDDEPFIKPFMVDIADAHYPIDITRASQRLGWSPQYRLSSMLRFIVRRMLADPRGFYEANGLTPPDKVAEQESPVAEGWRS